ncbi:MAG: T9SS type A sorting domain-containing protein [Opitutaceae bacterium]|nr:T9SS type A sorting domain-containing protein [Cytophagales bacterium]
MKARLLFATLFVCCFTSLNAQYYLIPDNTFSYILREAYSNCFKDNFSNNVDTNCLKSSGNTILQTSYQGIKNLEGIQYCKNLVKLSIAVNQITTIPALPEKLKIIDLGYNDIIEIKNLPTQLETLILDFSENIKLPEFPSTLKTLSMVNCNLSVVPSLPDGIVNLNLSQNVFTVLPNLPKALKNFKLRVSDVVDLPQLPDSLISLDLAVSMSIKCLPKLPSTLKTLDISYTAIACLPNIPVSLTTKIPLCSSSNNLNHCEIVAGLEENFKSKFHKVFPNPVKDLIVFEEASQFVIYSLMGNVVAKSDDFKTVYDCSKLSKGTYLLSLTSESQNLLTIKFIKD